MRFDDILNKISESYGKCILQMIIIKHENPEKVFNMIVNESEGIFLLIKESKKECIVSSVRSVKTRL